MIRLGAQFVAGFLSLALLAPLARLVPPPWPVPNVPVLITLYVALGVRGSPSAGAACAGILGYVTDLLTGAPKGTYVLALLLLYFIVRGLSSRLFVQGWVAQMGTAFAATLTSAFVVVAIHVVLPPRGTWSTLILAPFEAAITAGVAPVAFALLWRLDRRVAREASSEGVFR
jgi:rod shape-determining protein MreD